MLQPVSQTLDRGSNVLHQNNSNIIPPLEIVTLIDGIRTKTLSHLSESLFNNRQLEEQKQEQDLIKEKKLDEIIKSINFSVNYIIYKIG